MAFSAPALPPASEPSAPSTRRWRPSLRPGFVLTAGAAAFGLAAFAVSWWRWWTYKYETFDLAFYVQGLWLALRGGWHVSLLSVPLLGNHAEPIVYLVLPLFALCPHPMLLVGIQVIALATMPFTGRRIAKALGLPEWPAVALGLATIALPATGYVAIHEFHPEAFSAPLFLLIMEARLAGRLRRYWLWFALALGCKENIALVLALWSLVAAWEDRRLDRARQWQWNVLPGLIAVGWIIGYGGLISPAINGGQVDYGNLYTHLGATGGEMALNCFREPQRVWGALWQGVSGGNLLGGMLLSCAGLVLLRPRWLIIAAPIYLQHLLSARTSEWQIYYHYAAPLIPLFWLGAAEAISRSSRPSRWALAPLAVALTLQLAALIPGDLRVWRDFIKRGEPFALGQSPLLELWREIRAIDQSWWNRSWKAPVVESLARDPSLSVSAGLPYLSHLAERRELYSIHFVFKGLKTLSRRRYEASYTPDAVLIDFADGGTFGKAGGYYHPAGAIEGAPLPSSDELINRFLAREQWTATSWNALLLLRRSPGSALPPAPPADPGIELFPGTVLDSVRLAPASATASLALRMQWRYTAPRTNIPWLELDLIGAAGRYRLPLGMCAPESELGTLETKEVVIPPWIPVGRYTVEAVYLDQIRALWGQSSKSPVLGTVNLGEIAWPGRGE